ncbi:septum-promoting GTP-binding protein 1-like [Zingiber officinale]|uniref:septum-promoting GTP-binding protein 1-like n=1 Tax=Zingiber officinale TaxID=94328 RepID=UPI001C4D8462|nr:septum-promoting GTP-binding protein 1-like [Zingiber officinale]
MTRLGQTLAHVEARWFGLVRRLFHVVWTHLLSCSGGDGNDRRYRQLKPAAPTSAAAAPPEDEGAAAVNSTVEAEAEAEEVLSLKISLLGDCQIGKTSFMIKYVGDLEEQKGLEMTGLNLMDKIFVIKGATIAFRIWDVAGDEQSLDQVPIACKDAVAILIMFDLTSRCTLNNVICWHQRARKWNKTAIPILIGTKFDNFAELPLEMQWMIVNQARACARAMKATLFFSSTTHNINVNKIFKFIAAKLFNLPWTIERNLTIGEPIIDF